jgi:hypothetical protein
MNKNKNKTLTFRPFSGLTSPERAREIASIVKHERRALVTEKPGIDAIPSFSEEDFKSSSSIRGNYVPRK